MAERELRALVYGDVNMNLIDGSSVWAAATVGTLARAGCQVRLLLKTRVQRTTLLEPLIGLAKVTIARPFEDRPSLGPDGRSADDPRGGQANARARRTGDHFDIILIRGVQARLRDRRPTGVHRPPVDLPDGHPPVGDRDDRRGDRAPHRDCRRFALHALPDRAAPDVHRRGRAGGLRPERPLSAGRARRVGAGASTLRAGRDAQAGLFRQVRPTLEHPRDDDPARLAERGIRAELHAIGDKVHRDPADPGYQHRMQTALSSTPGLIWHGGLPREEAIRICADAHVGLGWRDAALDASLELSTKLLEYGSVGLPVVLNRTPMHEDLFGVDYPLFAGSTDDVVDALAAMATEPGLQGAAADVCRTAAAGYRLEAAAANVRVLLGRAFPSAPGLTGRERPLRVVIASHDLKFFNPILAQMRAMRELEVRVDAWSELSRHDSAKSQELVDWADVVICEWFGANAVWYSKHRRRGQRLVVRLHRFELYTRWLRLADLDRIDQVVCVSPHYATLAVSKGHVPVRKVTVVPNVVDDVDFDRPKLDGARFHLVPPRTSRPRANWRF